MLKSKYNNVIIENGIENITLENISKLFPHFDNNPVFKESFFNVISNANNQNNTFSNEKINSYFNFSDLIKVIATIAYGSRKERTEISMNISELEHKEFIDKKYFISYINKINEKLANIEGYYKLDSNKIAEEIFIEEVERIKNEVYLEAKNTIILKRNNNLPLLIASSNDYEEMEDHYENKKRKAEESTRPTKKLKTEDQSADYESDSDESDDDNFLSNEERLELLNYLSENKEYEARISNALENPTLKFDQFIIRASQFRALRNCFGFNTLIIKEILRSQDPSLTINKIERPVYSQLFTLPSSIQFEKEYTEEPSLEFSKAFNFNAKIDKIEGYLLNSNNVRNFISVKNGFMIFRKNKKEEPNYMIVLDTAVVGGDGNNNNKFFVKSKGKTYHFKIEDDKVDRNDWIEVIQKNSRHIGNPYSSFAPVRSNTQTKFFTNGSEYFKDLANNLKNAKKRILLTGWHLTYDLYLIREDKSNGIKGERLVDILKERAKNGVKIYIFLWRNIKLIFDLGNKTAKKNLQGENIYVILSPLTKNFTSSYHLKTCIIDNSIGYLGGIDISVGRYDDHSYELIDEEGIKFPEYDYTNDLAGMTKKYSSNGKNYEDENDYKKLRQKIPRVPWRDNQIKVSGYPVLDLERNFIQIWENSREYYNIIGKNIPYIVPHSKVNLTQLDHPNCNVQLLRSATKWSLGIENEEKSMYEAQIEAILNSKHFIYIENQFFFSSIEPGALTYPKNTLVEAIYNRILRAHKNNEIFRIVLLHPCQILEDIRKSKIATYTTIKQLHTSYRGLSSLMNRLKNNDVNVENYFVMVSARNFGRFSNKKIVTEIIYVHSKIMVVDDEIAFVSSHNINDRSLQGIYDAEMGARIEDYNKINVTFSEDKALWDYETSRNEENTNAREFAHKLRVRLFESILNLKNDERIKDPIKATDILRKHANNNTNTYLELFEYLQDNSKKTSDLNNVMNDTRSAIYSDEIFESLQNKIQGFVVNFPKDLLQEEDIKFNIFLNLFIQKYLV